MPGSPIMSANRAWVAARPQRPRAASEFRLAAEKRRVSGAACAQTGAASALTSGLGEPGGHGLGLALEGEGRQLLVGDVALSERIGERADHDATGRGRGLEARGRVHGVAGEERLAGCRVDIGVHEGFACVDTESHLNRVTVRPGERADFGGELESAAHRAFGVVVVGPREAEDGEHGIADELLDDATVYLDQSPRQSAVALQSASISSWSTASEWAVYETRSQNSVETTLRSSSSAPELGLLRLLVRELRAAPGQKAKSDGLTRPHEGQAIICVARGCFPTPGPRPPHLDAPPRNAVRPLYSARQARRRSRSSIPASSHF